ncbi:YbgF trimerization domain-containing protein [Sphingosinicella terrae]|uniref:YbgF trimerization domain-containing protein n=1 Tax=Sphingosinicella terrae TaxID=2172047 RepID=UPI0013B3F456|nr:tetratricopeptide repeat protein [Sphingosinicella terrae]
MRFHLIGLVLLASVASPGLAQRADSVERRVDRLEQELRAVQRRVFPNGRAQFVEPEIQPEAGGQPRPAVSGDALSNLAARVDAMETQLRSLTGQVEEQGYRTRQIEEQISRLRTDVQGRLDRLEQPVQPVETAPPASRPAAQPEPSTAEPAPPSAAPAADPAEEAYNAGYRLWDSGRFAEAQQALETAATTYPNSPWTSWMRNLQGRAYLDDDKPATAARVFLANYQDNPRGARAADSLYFLGQSLTRLNRRAEACRVYNELEQVYPSMRDFIRQRLPQARTDARCE